MPFFRTESGAMCLFSGVVSLEQRALPCVRIRACTRAMICLHFFAIFMFYVFSELSINPTLEIGIITTYRSGEQVQQIHSDFVFLAVSAREDTSSRDLPSADLRPLSPLASPEISTTPPPAVSADSCECPPTAHDKTHRVSLNHPSLIWSCVHHQ